MVTSTAAVGKMVETLDTVMAVPWTSEDRQEQELDPARRMGRLAHDRSRAGD